MAAQALSPAGTVRPPRALERPRPLRDQIYDRLKAAILSGEMAAGAPMIEVEIANRLGASRTPVREALRRLETEGLIEPRGARGTIVRELKFDEVACILEIREALETIAALRASRRMEKRDYVKMERLIKRMQKYVNDRSEMERLDTAFHDEILAHADGIRLKRMLGDLRTDILPLRFFSLATLERRQRVVDEHTAIVLAMESHDEATIVRTTASHIANTRAAIMSGATAGFGEIAMPPSRLASATIP